MTHRRNYYHVLHVQPDAPGALIKASYRTLLQSLGGHPDLGGAHEQAVLINDAYATLSDPDKRKAYDRELAWATEGSDAVRQQEQATDAAEPPRTWPARGGTVCPFCGAHAGVACLEDSESVCHVCGSALFSVRKDVGGTSRRAIARLPRSMPMTFRRAGRQEHFAATTADVSLNGICFRSAVALNVDELISLECQFCSAVAIVKNVRTKTVRGATHYQAGVELITLRIIRARGGLVSTVA